MKAFLLALTLAFTGVAAAQAALPPPYEAPAVYDGVVRTARHIESFDGTRLAISIFRPSKGGQVATERLPVIVMQARMESPQQLKTIRYYTDRGYVWVGQDRRGTGASFGRQTGFVNPRDVRDAKAVIEWAGAQAFSSGKVVAIGCSNQGVWQYRVSALDPKYLVAIAPGCASPQFFDDAVVMNGVPIFETGERHFAGQCNAVQPGARRSSGVASVALPVDGDADGALLKAAVAEQTCNAPMLGQFWLAMPRDGLNTLDNYRPAIEDSTVSQAAAVKRSGVAILQIGGWFDAAGAGQMASQSYWGGRVIMGPWMHGNRPPPDSRFPGPQIDLDAETLRWFDHHAKGVKNGAETPGVLYYTVGAPAGQEWRSAARWPWTGDRTTTYYFGAEGLSSDGPAAGAEPIAYAGRDVPWFEGRYQPLSHWWGGDMGRFDAISLSQTGAPLATDTEVTGTPVARLWISADTPDVNIFAVLEDVGPDGRSTYVTDGRLRASWRKLHKAAWGVSAQNWHRGYAKDLAPLKPGEPAELVFDFFPTSYVFKAGHRPRVSLITSMGQAYQAPPLAQGKAPTIRLHRDARRASAIDLPIAKPR